MKRLAAIILSALILFSFAACDLSSGNESPDTSETQQIKPPNEEIQFSPPSWESPLFSSYDDIRYAIIKLEKYGGIESFENSGIVLDQREQEIYDALRSIIGQPLAYSCRDDINSDGINELILYTNGYPKTPIAAFGMKDGKPIVLKNALPINVDLHDYLRSITEWNNPHYKIFTYEEYESSDKSRKYEYEIYGNDGKIVKHEQADSRILIWQENDLLVISISSSDYTDGYSYRKRCYSISQNKFSDEFFDALAFSDDKVVYSDNGVLTVQNIFDKSVFYEQYPEYKYPSSASFDPDGKSFSFYSYVENQRKPAIKTVCFERLPIIKALYSRIPIFYEPYPDCPLQLSSHFNEWAYLRSATEDTARLLDTHPIKTEWNGEVLEYYKILYFGRECFVYANDLIEVTYYGDENQSTSVKTKDEVIDSVLSSFPDLDKEHNFYAEDLPVSFNFTSPENGYFFAFSPVINTLDVQLDVFLKTQDGGESWQPITVANPPILNWKERVLCAKMVNSEVGLISGRFYAESDNISDRTYITTDGGITWENVEIPTDNRLTNAEVYDFVSEDWGYYLCLRAKIDSKNYQYFEYYSRNLENWDIVDRGK